MRTDGSSLLLREKYLTRGRARTRARRSSSAGRSSLRDHPQAHSLDHPNCSLRATQGQNRSVFFRTCGEHSVWLGDLGPGFHLGRRRNLGTGRILDDFCKRPSIFWRAGFSPSQISVHCPALHYVVFFAQRIREWRDEGFARWLKETSSTRR
jgi:hypothetical protein